MRNAIKGKASLALVLGLLAGGPALGCEIWWEESEIWEGYRTNCNLADFFPKLDAEIVWPSGPVLKSPDLKIPKYKYFPMGSGLELQVDAENIGSAESRTTSIHTVFTVMDVSGGALSPSESFQTSVPRLTPGQRIRLGVGFPDISAADTDGNGVRDVDVDLVVMGSIDTPTMSQPNGNNLEIGGEGNNMIVETCRLYHGDSGPWNYTNPPGVCD